MFPKPPKREKSKPKGLSRTGFNHETNARRSSFDWLYRHHVRPGYFLSVARAQGRLARSDEGIPGETAREKVENLKSSELPLCEVRAPGTECAAKGGHLGVQIHHKQGRGRRKKSPHRLVDTTNMALVCSECHDYIHGHSEWSRSEGWMISRHDKIEGSG